MSVIIEKITTINIPDGRLGYDFIMTDETKNINLTISNSTYCCETYGVFTESTMKSFIGATYLFTKINDITDCQDKQDENSKELNIDIHTDRGIISIKFYNHHNGYYSHDINIEYEHGTHFLHL